MLSHHQLYQIEAHFLRIKNRTNKKIMQYDDVKSDILVNLKNERYKVTLI